mmetsp:Transcript_32043/g.41194  ORF Transcript_32043/g.41194 Transcript_32043/m.41194 type:complete len:624 (+) Transcript_32043:56-1927(+)
MDEIEPLLLSRNEPNIYAQSSEKNKSQDVHQQYHRPTKYSQTKRVGTLVMFLGVVVLLLILWDVGFQSKKEEKEKSARTNIIFFLIDDLGYNDIGYTSSDISNASPTMTSYAQDGVILTSYYTYAQCTPSRSSLFTGMYASSIGLQHDCLQPVSNFGVPLSYSLLPQVLNSISDYKTAMVGKWDLGHYAPSLWPTQRGFESSLHLSCYGYTDYHGHLNMGGVGDLHDNLNNAYAGTDPDIGISVSEFLKDRTYPTFVFTRRVLKIISEFVYEVSDLTAKPGLFLYIAWNAVHSTLSIPNGYNTTSEYLSLIEDVNTDSNSERALLAGALRTIDNCFLDIMEELGTFQLLQSSVVVVASDNGGSVTSGGNNYPLRGWKKTTFEGGVRVPAFIYSPLLAQAARGSEYSDLFHVADWLPTLAYGLQGRVSTGSFDGVDHWAKLSTARVSSTEPARSMLPCHLDYLQYDGMNAFSATDIRNVTGCVILEENQQRYKFIWNEGDYGWALPSSTELVTATATLAMMGKQRAFLFDLYADPEETTNLLWDDSFVSIAQLMTEAFCEFYQSMVPCLWKPNDGAAKDAFYENDMFITYWEESVDERSDFANSDGSITGPPCSSTALLEIIYE